MTTEQEEAMAIITSLPPTVSAERIGSELQMRLLI